MPILLLCACQRSPVAEDLTQKQANEIVAALGTEGIAAESSRARGGKALFAVSVDKEHYSEAVSILEAKNLPSEKQPTFAEVIAPQGLIPNSREIESLRVERALAADVEETLLATPAIVSVRAIVRRSTAIENSFPSVAVIAVTRPGGEISSEQIVALVMRAVPGTLPDHISVSLSEQQLFSSAAREGVQRIEGKTIPLPIANFLGLLRIAKDDYEKMATILIVVISLVLVTGALIGFIFGFASRRVPRHKSNLTPLGSDEPRRSLPSE